MQYEIEDIVGQQDYKSHYLLSAMLDACQDVLEALVADEVASEQFTDNLRQKINTLFGPRNIEPELIDPKSFFKKLYQQLRPKFVHRRCLIETVFDSTDPILIPSEVLSKVFEGLLRNAIENTPDVSKIVVYLTQSGKGPELKVQDFGVGISNENQRLIFDNFFAAYETAQYSSKRSYDFNAGGKGFDLIRMQIFAERYNFKLKMASKRCPHIAEEQDGDSDGGQSCENCKLDQACLSSGTTMTVQFKSAKEYKGDG